MTAPPRFDARRAFRARDGRLLVTLGGALAIAALLLTALAAHDIGRNERWLAGLEARLDSTRTLLDTATHRTALEAGLAETEAAVAAARGDLANARARRDDLWTLTGASTLLAAVGGLLVGAGIATLRRARNHGDPGAV